jgi:hypothetical protein
MRAGEVPEQNGFAGPDGTDGIDGVARALLSL